MKDKYYEQAVICVKDTVLLAQIRLYKSCGTKYFVYSQLPGTGQQI